jgi:hypothetical protein
MTTYSFTPTPESYRESFTALKALGEVNIQCFGAVAERQKVFLAAWWQHCVDQAMAFTSATDPNKFFDTAGKASADYTTFFQEQTKTTLDLFNSTGDAVTAWQRKYAAPEIKPSSPPAPARVASGPSTKAA